MTDDPARKLDPKDVAATSATAAAQRAGGGIFRRNRAATAVAAKPSRKGPGVWLTAILFVAALVAMLALMIAAR